MKKVAKHPEEMSEAELAAACKEFDKPYAFEKTRPMTPEERAIRRERDEGPESLRQSIVPGELTKRQWAEVHRRIESLDSGKSHPISGEEVMREFPSASPCDFVGC